MMNDARVIIKQDNPFLRETTHQDWVLPIWWDHSSSYCLVILLLSLSLLLKIFRFLFWNFVRLIFFLWIVFVFDKLIYEFLGIMKSDKQLFISMEQHNYTDRIEHNTRVFLRKWVYFFKLIYSVDCSILPDHTTFHDLVQAIIVFKKYKKITNNILFVIVIINLRKWILAQIASYIILKQSE